MKAGWPVRKPSWQPQLETVVGSGQWAVARAGRKRRASREADGPETGGAACRGREHTRRLALI